MGRRTGEEMEVWGGGGGRVWRGEAFLVAGREFFDLRATLRLRLAFMRSAPSKFEGGGMQVATRMIVGFRCVESDGARLVASDGEGAGMPWNQGFAETLLHFRNSGDRVGGRGRFGAGFRWRGRHGGVAPAKRGRRDMVSLALGIVLCWAGIERGLGPVSSAAGVRGGRAVRRQEER